MKQLALLTACISALALAPLASAQTAEKAPAKPTAQKAAPKKPAARKTTRAKAAAGGAAAAAVVPQGVKWDCELGNHLYIDGDMPRAEVITLNWKGANHKLPRQTTVTGADRYYDPQSGLDLVVIPSKAMLFDKRAGQRLTDECQTEAMRAGEAAPTQAGALRAPVVAPLLVPQKN
ncbi:hypothetical protein MW7_005595 [Imbroritus primus]|uniref:Uncharacterized protein n=1 Tax=Imbroritus primus TaxID=3058603 RepID=A0ACD3SPS0_9BURK|nr:hypothetical protein MW7_005595 [Burkholderiaceae bacterium PBA]